ncbi:MAG TPA: glucose-6-phosphate dehydrogenase, partial [Phycisphaerae bacterium]|nr:glucose-6-phosphate dehydrogenase [Phycisphaerae bacterium]
MEPRQSDAFVFFGATGDLAKKKIFPALHAMARRGRLRIPVIGVSRSAENVEALRALARESIEQHGGGIDPAAFDRLIGLLKYVRGDHTKSPTFHEIR